MKRFQSQRDLQSALQIGLEALDLEARAQGQSAEHLVSHAPGRQESEQMTPPEPADGVRRPNFFAILW